MEGVVLHMNELPTESHVELKDSTMVWVNLHINLYPINVSISFVVTPALIQISSHKWLQDVQQAPKNLLAMAVGIKQNASVNSIIEKVGLGSLTVFPSLVFSTADVKLNNRALQDD